VTEFPWRAEHRVDPESAATLGRLAFRLPCKTVELLGEGWDFITYLADRSWVLRFPKRTECDRALIRERNILERLHRFSLPVAVPRFEHFSPARDGFPWHFAGYRYLRGTPLSHIRDEATMRAIAPAIGAFLAALHKDTFEVELPTPRDGGESRAEWASHTFTESVHAYPSDLRKQIKAFLQSPWPVAPDVPQVLAHADLLEDHILVNTTTTQLAGIIDWTDACTTIRSSDFVGLYYAGGRDFTARAYAAYGVEADDGEWQWLHHSAIAIGIEEVYYGYNDEQPSRLAQALERLRRHVGSGHKKSTV
jgi:aminoglycoside phosphotransferase (APT) family kinase protein